MNDDIDKFRRRRAQKEIEALINEHESATRARMFTFLGTVGGILESRSEYGPVEVHWSRTAALWSLLLEHKLTEPLDSRDVARLYIADKLSRDVTPRPVPLRDTALDIAGYAAGMASMEPDYEVEP